MAFTSGLTPSAPVGPVALAITGGAAIVAGSVAAHQSDRQALKATFRAGVLYFNEVGGGGQQIMLHVEMLDGLYSN